MAKITGPRWCFWFLVGLSIVSTQIAQPIHASEVPSSINGIYSGTVGHHRIVLGIGRDPAREDSENSGGSRDPKIYPIEGRYFYRRHGVDIHLVGMPLADGSFRLREYRRAPEDEFSAEWRLKIQGDRAAGVFCKCELNDKSKPAGSLLKISLKRLSYELEDKDEDLYDELVLAFPLKDGPEIKVSTEVAYRMRSDSRFEVRRPQLTRFPDVEVMARINRAMAHELRRDRLKASVNLSEAHFGTALGGFYNEWVGVSFFLPDILSVVVDQNWYWGGAHPNEATYSLDYNLHTGRRFELDKALQTATGKSTESDIAHLLSRLYLRHYVQPSVAYKWLYEKPSGEVVEMSCKEIIRDRTSNEEEPFSATLYLSEKGLVISPILPYTEQECGPEVTIPYPELRPFVKRNSMLQLLVEARAGNLANQRCVDSDSSSCGP